MALLTHKGYLTDVLDFTCFWQATMAQRVVLLTFCEREWFGSLVQALLLVSLVSPSTNLNY